MAYLNYTLYTFGFEAKWFDLSIWIIRIFYDYRMNKLTQLCYHAMLANWITYQHAWLEFSVKYNIWGQICNMNQNKLINEKLFKFMFNLNTRRTWLWDTKINHIPIGSITACIITFCNQLLNLWTIFFEFRNNVSANI